MGGFMKANRRVSLVTVSILIMILTSGYQPVVAAPPTGEIKIVASTWGNEVPIPFRERGAGADYMRLLYDPLVGSTPDSRLSTEHSLAKRWEMSPDALVWTIHLRNGVKFHDGVELTAKDVKFSIEQTMRLDAKGGKSGGYRETVKSMEIKDPYTLIIRCKKPSIFLPSLLSDVGGVVDSLVQPKDYYEKVGEDQFLKRPIGTGPYKFHSQTAGSFIKLEATDRHWLYGVPRYKYVTFLVIPEESTRISMLRTSMADIAPISRERIKETLDAGLKLVSKKEALSVVFVPTMQWASPVFSDIRFRKALNLAIDKEAIIKYIFLGKATPTTSFVGGAMFGCGGDPTLKPYPYNPEEARRLIRESGYEGHEFDVTSIPRAECVELPQLTEAVVGYWKKIGLRPKINVMELAAFREIWESRKCVNWVYGKDEQATADCAWLITRLQQYFHGSQKRSFTDLPEANAMIKKLLITIDPAEVPRLIREFHRYEYNNYLTIPICDISQEVAANQRIPNWNPGTRPRDKNFNDLIRQ